MKRSFCSGKSLSTSHHQPLVSTIMEKVVNGTEVIEKGLNSCILATTESAHSIDFAIKIDFLKLFGRKTRRQCCVMEEILDMTSNFDSARELVKHPVIAAFIWAKWEKSKKYYYLHALLYMAFLLFYSVMVYQLFGGGGNKVPVKDCKIVGNSTEGEPGIETGCVLKLWFQAEWAPRGPRLRWRIMMLLTTFLLHYAIQTHLKCPSGPFLAFRCVFMAEGRQ